MHVLCFFFTNDEECSVSVGSFINMYEYFMFNVQLSLICWSLSWEDLGLHRPTKSSQQRNSIHMFTTAWLFRYDEVIRLKTTTKTEISIFVGAQWVTGAVGVEDVNCSLFEQRLLYSRLNIDGTPGSFQDISILPSSPSCLLCLIFSPSSLPVRLSFPPCVETVPRLLESVTDSSPRKLPSFSFFFFCPLLFFTPTLHTLTHILPVKSVFHRWIGTVIYKFGAAYRGVCIETGEHSRPGDISYFQFPDALSQRDITADA